MNFREVLTRQEDEIISNVYEFISLGDWETAEKIIKSKPYLFPPLRIHFIYNELQKVYYKKREENYYLSKALEVCLKDFDLIKKGLVPIYQTATLPCIERLVIIYEKTGNVTAAMEVLRYAVDNYFVGNYASKLQKLYDKTSTITISKPKRIKEVYNDDGLCERELAFINALNAELAKRKLITKFIPFIKSTGVMAIRFSNAYITNVKIRNNTDEYYKQVIESIPEWVDFVEGLEKPYK